MKQRVDLSQIINQKWVLNGQVTLANINQNLFQNDYKLDDTGIQKPLW